MAKRTQPRRSGLVLSETTQPGPAQLVGRRDRRWSGVVPVTKAATEKRLAPPRRAPIDIKRGLRTYEEIGTSTGVPKVFLGHSTRSPGSERTRPTKRTQNLRRLKHFAMSGRPFPEVHSYWSRLLPHDRALLETWPVDSQFVDLPVRTQPEPRATSFAMPIGKAAKW